MLDVQAMDRPCVKCNAPGAIYRDNDTSDFFCHGCFTINIKLKFRFTLSRTRLFNNSWNENKPPVRVLVLVERNARAEALLKLIDLNANDSDEKKRFRLDAEVYIINSDQTGTPLDEKTKIGNFNASNIHLSSVLNSSSDDKLNLYNDFMNAMPTKSIEYEFKRLMFDLLIWKLCTQMNINLALTSENSEAIAQKSMTSLWFGRSSSVCDLANTLDARHPNAKIVRPMRSINNVELEFLVNGGDFSGSGDSISSKFLENVAENGFPGIVSTVLSVASKLDTNSIASKVNDLSISNNVSHCPLCRMRTIEKLCEPCNRLISQIPVDKQKFVLNSLCSVVE